MSNNQLITREWNNKTFTFREDGYFNMTKAAKEFGKRHDNFLANDDTKAYANELEAVTGISGTDLIQAQRGGRNPGTWAHPKLAVFFARWLDVRFAVACDQMIEEILKGNVEVKKKKEVLPTVRKATQQPDTKDATIKLLAQTVERLSALQVQTFRPAYQRWTGGSSLRGSGGRHRES